MWLAAQLQPRLYNERYQWRVQGALDVGRLEAALCEIVERHEVLRTTLFMSDQDQLVQRVNRCPTAILNLLHEKSAGAAEKSVLALADQPFSLESDIPVRPYLVSYGRDDHILALAASHAAFDAASARILVSELEKLYAFQPIPSLEFQYRDYAIRQREATTTMHWDELASYWRRAVEGVGRETVPDEALDITTTAEEAFTVSPRSWARVRRIARTFKVPTTHVLLALTLNACGDSFGHEGAVAVCVGIDERGDDFRSNIGFFANLLLLAAHHTKPARFLDDAVIEQCAAVAEAYAYGAFPFHHALRVGGLRYGNVPVFVSFHDHGPFVPARIGSARLDRLVSQSSGSRFPLWIAFEVRGFELAVVVRHFLSPALQTIAHRFSRMLLTALALPNRPGGTATTASNY